MTDPVSALLAAVPSLAKAGADIAAASSEAKRNAQLIEFQRVVIQLQSSIAAIQVQNAALLNDKNELEKKIMGFENWEREKQRYSLVSILSGAVAYALKESMSNGEAAHWLCPRCFEQRQKSVLHPFEGANRFFGVACPSCPTKIQGPFRNASTPEYAPG